jgi:hypothetical protein
MKRLRFITILLLLFVAPVHAQQTVMVSVTPNIETSAYATGDVIGELMEFEGALREVRGSGHLSGAIISNKAAQAVDLELWVFFKEPENSTLTDNSAIAVSDDDIANGVMILSFGSATRFTSANNIIHYLGNQLHPVFGRIGDRNSTSSSLWAVLVSRGSPTFGSAADLTVTLGIAQD